jgi:ketosteroid isomerase-like protein
MALATIAAAGALSACGGEPSGPTRVAERFYAAVERGDGERACAQLSDDAVSELESQEGAACPRAVVKLELSGTRAEHAEAYVTTAKVEMDGGDRVFLDETAAGWRVAAAGCRPEPGEEAPADCEVEA